MNAATALGRVLVDELVRCGVTEVALAPGSRSAPLAFAFHQADADRRLRLHVRIDERSAGFLALGPALSTGIAAVVTTSGTAVANLHPAVLEAHHTGVPLLVLSADRLGETRGVGANQTIDQAGIFGDVVRCAHDLAAPDSWRGQGAYWRSTACRAVSAARGTLGGDPGPGHLNVALREPLVPTGADAEMPAELAGRPNGAAWTVASQARGVDAAGLAMAGDVLAGPSRTLVVIGDAPRGGPELRRSAAGLGPVGRSSPSRRPAVRWHRLLARAVCGLRSLGRRCDRLGGAELVPTGF